MMAPTWLMVLMIVLCAAFAVWNIFFPPKNVGLGLIMLAIGGALVYQLVTR